MEVIINMRWYISIHLHPRLNRGFGECPDPLSGTNYDLEGRKQAQDESLQYEMIVYPKDIWFLGAPNFFLNGVACRPKE